MAIKNLYVINTYSGLSSDTKPTSPPAGSTFYETDTKQTFFYNGTSWVIREGEEFDVSVYPVRAQGTTDGVQYYSTGATTTAATDIDLWTFDSYDYHPRLAGNLAWCYYNVSMELKAGSTGADLKWRLKARDRGSTAGWVNMCAEQTETDINTTYVAKQIEGYLDIQTGAELMPLEMKVVMQSNESSTASGEGIGRIKNDTIIRLVGEVK